MQRNPEARNTISDLRGVLVSFGCHVKVPQTEWLKTTEIYFLTVLDARSLKSDVRRAMLSLKALRKALFQAFLLASDASSNTWCFLTCGHISQICASSLI